MSVVLLPSDPHAPPRPLPVSTWATWGWAAFLACSWTWCIGMYLPVLLIREHGLWGWIIFAVPNVVGAAAMGWILRRDDSSLQITTNHLSACAGFSWVTIAFHCFFATWLIRAMAGVEGLTAMVLVTAAAWVLVRRDAWALAASGLVFVISLDVMLFLLLQDELAPPEVMLQRPGGLAWIAAACVGGFALCPYLDLTFHRARGATTPAGARAAFSLGFGVLFLAMIVATLLYAHLLKLMIAGPVLAVLSVHLINQSGFTLAVHLRELTRRGAPLVAAGVVGCLAAVGAGLMSVDEARGEMFYLCFMGFYGLVFPAYVWLCVWPTRGRERPSSRALVVWLVATLLAVPTFWMGFVKTRPAWLGLGLGVVLLARLLVGPHRPARAEP